MNRYGTSNFRSHDQKHSFRLCFQKRQPCRDPKRAVQAGASRGGKGRGHSPQAARPLPLLQRERRGRTHRALRARQEAQRAPPLRALALPPARREHVHQRPRPTDQGKNKRKTKTTIDLVLICLFVKQIILMHPSILVT